MEVLKAAILHAQEFATIQAKGVHLLLLDMSNARSPSVCRDVPNIVWAPPLQALLGDLIIRYVWRQRRLLRTNKAGLFFILEWRSSVTVQLREQPISQFISQKLFCFTICKFLVVTTIDNSGISHAPRNSPAEHGGDVPFSGFMVLTSRHQVVVAKRVVLYSR